MNSAPKQMTPKGVIYRLVLMAFVLLFLKADHDGCYSSGNETIPVSDISSAPLDLIESDACESDGCTSD